MTTAGSLQYRYRATVVRVIDGDTVVLDFDLGMHIGIVQSCRLLGINAAEHGTEAGDAATAYLSALLKPGTEVIAHTQKDQTEKYGRYLVEIALLDGLVMNQQMLATGHALPWDGKGTRPV